MTKIVQAKHKICRRQLAPVCGSPKCPVHKRNFTPGQHGPVSTGRVLSDFGKQLRAKQQLKKAYGRIRESQFLATYKEAARRRGNTSEVLIALLESRLDSFVFRAKFAPTMFAARQLVSHKHFKVNGQTVNIPSYHLKEGDVVEVREGSKQVALIIESASSPDREVPDYIQSDAKALKGTFTRFPKLDDVPYPVVMEPHLVVEFYSH